MTEAHETRPEIVADDRLDDATGGSLPGLLVPAIQKVRESGANDTTRKATGSINIALGDGSVRTP